MPLSRRIFLAASTGAAVASAWESGSVHHLLPTASHDRIRVKASFTQPLVKAPLLRAGGARVTGQRTDSAGLYWQFDASGLKPGTRYDLELTDGKRRIADPWPLRTLPHPEERVDRFRLLVYTCAGGHDGVRIAGSGAPYWVSIANRRKLFAAGLARNPDAVLAIGDHVYFDLRFGRGSGNVAMSRDEWALREVGSFQRDIPVIGTPNEQVLHRAVKPQIADLYGTLMRSVPTFFIQDDHDYFENDEAIPAGREPNGVSLPPDDFMLHMARATRRMYFPEFLPDATRPDFSGSGEAYGTIRFGRAAELMVYDCRRYLSLTGSYAGFLSDAAERWLMNRMQQSNARHVVNVPSTPIAWSAGKWGEWYPDLLLDDGSIGTLKPKYMWQSGWKAQHDRLLAASTAMRERIPLFLSGDLHALAHGAIRRNGTQDFRNNPVHSVLTGPVSTGPRGWPSAARGTPPLVPTGLEVDQDLKPMENNGFTIADFLPDRIEFQMFRWKMDRPESELDNMEPFHKFTISRRS